MAVIIVVHNNILSPGISATRIDDRKGVFSAHTSTRTHNLCWLVGCGINLNNLDQPWTWDIRETGDGARDSSSAPPATRLWSARQFHSIAGALRRPEFSNCSSYTMSKSAYLAWLAPCCRRRRLRLLRRLLHRRLGCPSSATTAVAVSAACRTHSRSHQLAQCNFPNC